MSEKKYSSSEVQKMFHITRPTLRYYMDKGLVCGEKDEDNGYLFFDKQGLDDLWEVSFFRQLLDFNTKEIAGYLQSSSLSDVSSVLFMRKELLKREIEKRKKQMEILTSIEKCIETIATLENTIQILHFDEVYPVLVPLESVNYQDEHYSSEVISDEDLYWYCNVFCRDFNGKYRHRGYGYFLDLPSQHEPEYNPEEYVLKLLEPGDYLYGVQFTMGDYTNPSIMQPFLDYAEEHGLQIEDTAYSVLYFIDRTKEKRRYCYDVTIPLQKCDSD